MRLRSRSSSLHRIAARCLIRTNSHITNSILLFDEIHGKLDGCATQHTSEPFHTICVCSIGLHTAKAHSVAFTIDCNARTHTHPSWVSASQKLQLFIYERVWCMHAQRTAYGHMQRRLIGKNIYYLVWWRVCVCVCDALRLIENLSTKWMAGTDRAICIVVWVCRMACHNNNNTMRVRFVWINWNNIYNFVQWKMGWSNIQFN